jgi:hypothetical protein
MPTESRPLTGKQKERIAEGHELIPPAQLPPVCLGQEDARYVQAWSSLGKTANRCEEQPSKQEEEHDY